ncbi:MAG: hypothetical protein EXS03_06210 [Phycisphaerales bacterium]|nr:hypothetical protein [Phycisphaerales bacterium]
MAAFALAGALAAGGVDEVFGPVPSPRQLRWQAHEQCMFIHFGVNTFTGAEWGQGKESPAIFDPKELDCRQWVRVAREAGFKGIVITAKHHDGFCLWPSPLTEHSVKAAPWRGGSGDVLRELSAACREAGMGFGVYLSPWDRNNPKYGTGAEYNDYFAAQLRDVLTNYGPVFEVWFDGACGEGPDGHRQEYDWKKFVAVVRECQPDAVIFSDAGPDIRWVGNERGIGCETNWCRLTLSDLFPGIAGRNDELCHGQCDGVDWIQAEADVSIRPGWFWRESESAQVKTPAELVRIWIESVGRGCNLLLNVPVDRRGLIGDADIASLRGFASAIAARTVRDVGSDAEVVVTATETIDTPSTTELRWKASVSPRLIRLEEFVQLGQRVEAFRLESLAADGSWRKLAHATTIGVRRILEVEPMPTRAIRIIVEKSRARARLSRVSVYE